MKRTAIFACVSAIVFSLGAGLAATATAASQFEGTVVAKNTGKRTFAIKQDQGGGTFTFKVTNATKYQRIAGFAAIKRGDTGIGVVARRAENGGLVALQVERSGKSGGGGGGGGNDDPPNHQ